MKNRKAIYIFFSLIFVLCSITACTKNEFRVEFFVDGTLYGSLETKGGKLSALPEDPLKDGFIFDGWYYDKDIWQRPLKVESPLEASLHSTISVYAKWKAAEKETYRVTFDGGEGTYVSGSLNQTIERGKGATAPVFTKDGLTLTWNKAFDNIKADIVVSAVWVAKVNFSVNGGTGIAELLTSEGCKIPEPQCAKIGNKLKYWYQSSDGGATEGEIWSFDTDTVQRDLTLYAKWEKDIEYFTPGIQFTLVNASEYEISNGKIYNESEIYLPAFYKGKPVTGIGEEAFFGLDGLETITIPDTIKNIDANAFSHCYNLSVLTMGGGVEYIGKQAFYINESLSEITFIAPERLKSIDDSAFNGCIALTEMPFFENLKRIGEFAFRECERLSGIKISSTVTYIGVGAFERTASLRSVEAESDNIVYTSENGVLLNKAKTVLVSCPSGKTGSYSIPVGVTRINKNAFNGSLLTEIIIPEGVISIDEYSIDACANLAEIVIPKSVMTLADRAFGNNYHLSSITFAPGSKLLYIGAQTFIYAPIQSLILPEGLLEIGAAAFAGCGRLNDIRIPASVTKIGGSVFDDCAALERIEVDGLSEYFCSIDGVLFDKKQTVLLRYPAGKTGAYDIPDSVSTVGDNAFQKCYKLTAVTIPNMVTSIETGAFLSCTGISSVTLTAGITYMDAYAFGRWTAGQTIFVRGLAGIPAGWSRLWNEGSDDVVVWSPINTVVFDANGGTGEMSCQKIVAYAKEPLNLNGFAREGYKFTGWAESPDGQARYLDGDEFSMDGKAERTLYAVWERIYFEALQRCRASGAISAPEGVAGALICDFFASNGSKVIDCVVEAAIDGASAAGFCISSKGALKFHRSSFEGEVTAGDVKYADGSKIAVGFILMDEMSMIEECFTTVIITCDIGSAGMNARPGR